MATEQIAVRLPTEQLKVLDELLNRGVYAMRAAAVRAGIEALSNSNDAAVTTIPAWSS